MKHKEVDKHFRQGITCPICGMHLIDLEHDGYESGKEHYHTYFCSDCFIDFTVDTTCYRENHDQEEVHS